MLSVLLRNDTCCDLVEVRLDRSPLTLDVGVAGSISLVLWLSVGRCVYIIGVVRNYRPGGFFGEKAVLGSGTYMNAHTAPPALCAVPALARSRSTM
eukprot:COSAG06_NODE_8266_length_2220_cov_8.222941_2_plen_96_part_00